MSYRAARLAMASLMGASLLLSVPAVAQETPVIAELSQDHETTSEGYPFTGFGQSVIIRGNLALVGVPEFVYENPPGTFRSGLVEIYAGDASGATWTRTGSLYSPDPLHQQAFGSQLALSGKQRLAVGSFGAIQLFQERQAQWIPLSSIELSPADLLNPNQPLVYTGDTLAFTVFENQTDSVPGSQTGYFVYVYRIDREGNAHLAQKLAPSADDTAPFGTSLALGHDLLVIGSPGGFGNGDLPGQVYVYSRRGEHWVLSQKIQSPTGAPKSGFGAGVAIDHAHHAILIGAAFEDFVGDDEFIQASGELYVFRKAHGVWAEIQETRPTGVGAFAEFGAIIAARDGRVAVGAPSTTDVFNAGFGPTVIYRWEGDTLVQDNYVPNLLAASLDVYRNRIIIGENRDVRGGFANKAVVLTYPAATDTDADD